jgi:hypothetical protein
MMPESFHLTTHIILAPSAPAANTHMARHHHSFSHPERLWFFCYGNLPSQRQIANLLPILHNKKVILLYEDDLLGRIATIKIACWLKRRDVQISYQPSETFQICFNGKCYHFPEHKLSLSNFEKYTGLRSRIKAHKTVF